MEFIALDNQPFSVVGDGGFAPVHTTKCAIFQMLPYRSCTVIVSLLLASRLTFDQRYQPHEQAESDSTMDHRGFRTEESRIACS
jgi:hypothetical protein